MGLLLDRARAAGTPLASIEELQRYAIGGEDRREPLREMLRSEGVVDSGLAFTICDWPSRKALTVTQLLRA